MKHTTNSIPRGTIRAIILLSTLLAFLLLTFSIKSDLLIGALISLVTMITKEYFHVRENDNIRKENQKWRSNLKE